MDIVGAAKKHGPMKLSHALRRLVLALLTVAVCLPLAIIFTIVLLPVWSWIEATYGIEAVGHSGPSDWCFWLVFGTMSSIAVAMLFKPRKPPRYEP